MTKSIESMFESIKESLKFQKGSASFKEFLRLEATNTYAVRFIPNIEDGKKTFFPYFHHGWTSLSTGQYVDSICPSTWGDRCVICEERFKLYRQKTEEAKALAKNLFRLEKRLANVYVITDPVTPENEGTIKILRFGKRIYEKIIFATEGDDAAIYGRRIVDLSPNGCNFRIRVESNQEGKRQFTNYSNSQFMPPSEIPGMTPEKIEQTYKGIYNLEDFIEVKEQEQMQKMIDLHLYCKGGKGERVQDAEKKKIKIEEDNLNYSTTPTPVPTTPAPVSVAQAAPTPVPANVPAPTPAPAPASTTQTSVAQAPSAPQSNESDKIKNLLADLDKI